MTSAATPTPAATGNGRPTSGRWTSPVYVREDQRGRGVGRALYERLLPLLADLGYCQAFAGIAQPNPGSVGLHEALGFEAIGVYRRVGFKLGAWRDVGWWQKPLAGGDTPLPPRPFTGLDDEE